MKLFIKKIAGFTLIEILVGIFVFTLLCTAAFLAFSYGLKISVYNATRVQLQRNARTAMERMLTEAKDAVFLPWQSAGAYSPKTPPSPVFAPFITSLSSNSIFCFTAPAPSSSGAIGFDNTNNSSYRLICYYVDPNHIPSDPNTNPYSNTSALIRRKLQFGTTLSTQNIIQLDWTLLTLAPKTWDWTSDPNSRPEVIIQMPFPSDTISFIVTHEQNRDYWTSRKVEFQAASAIYHDQDAINDPLSFKITMTLSQYPYGKTTYNKQELTVDGSIQIRSAYH